MASDDSIGATPAADQPPSPGPLLPWIAGGVVTGALAPDSLAVASGLALSTPVLWWLLGLPLALLALLADGPAWPWARRCALFAAACLLGGTLAGRADGPDAGRARVLEVEGEVTQVAWQGATQGVVMQARRVLAPEGVSPGGRLFVRLPGLPGIEAGDRIRVRGRWSRDLRGERLDAVAVLRLIDRERGPRGWAWRAVDHLGARRELAGSLLIGSGEPEEKALFRQAGLQHVLAVSGMHLAIAAALSGWLLRLFGVPWTARLLALGALVLGYLWLTGATPATQRAAAMSLAVSASLLLSREPHRLAAVSLAALGLVALSPGSAADRGFQLSLAAVAGIVTLGLDLVRLRQRLLPLAPWPGDRAAWRWLLAGGRALSDGLGIGVAASLATAPIVAWHFGVLNPWSPIASLAAAPPTTAALWLGLPALALGGWAPDGPWEGLFILLEWSLDALVAVVRIAAQCPGASLAVAPPPAWALLAWPMLFAPLRSAPALAARVAALALLALGWWWASADGGSGI